MLGKLIRTAPLLLTLMLYPVVGHSFSAADARACVENGIKAVQTGASLTTMIESHLGQTGLAQLVAARARLDFKKDRARIDAAINAFMQKRIAQEEHSGRIDTNSITLMRYIKPIGNAYEVAGYYTRNGGRESFALLVAPGCYVWDATWQNVKLTQGIALQLR